MLCLSFSLSVRQLVEKCHWITRARAHIRIHSCLFIHVFSFIPFYCACLSLNRACVGCDKRSNGDVVVLFVCVETVKTCRN